MAALAPLAVLSEIKFFHVEGVQMFNPKTLDAGGLLSVVKLKIKIGGEASKKELVEKIWEEHVKTLLDEASGLEHTAGWRIEKEEGREGEEEEFVVVGAWQGEDALTTFKDGTWMGAKAWEKAWRNVGAEMDVKTYRRIA
jgi:hypothetical protein